MKLYHAITNGTSSVDHQTLNTIFNSSLPHSIPESQSKVKQHEAVRSKVSAFINMLFFHKVRIVSKNFRELTLRKHFALLLRQVSFEKALVVIWLFLCKSSSMTSKYCILKISL